MRESKGRYIFHNQNPKKRLNVGDCVFRSLSFALDKSWDEVYLELCEIGFELKSTPTSNDSIEKFLEKKGFRKEKQLRHKNNKKYTADQFAKEFDKGTFIIRQANHISVIKDGFIYDTWNNSDYTVGNYWRVK